MKGKNNHGKRKFNNKNPNKFKPKNNITTNRVNWSGSDNKSSKTKKTNKNKFSGKNKKEKRTKRPISEKKLIELKLNQGLNKLISSNTPYDEIKGINLTKGLLRGKNIYLHKECKSEDIFIVYNLHKERGLLEGYKVHCERTNPEGDLFKYNKELKVRKTKNIQSIQFDDKYLKNMNSDELKKISDLLVQKYLLNGYRIDSRFKNQLNEVI